MKADYAGPALSAAPGAKRVLVSCFGYGLPATNVGIGESRADQIEGICAGRIDLPYAVGFGSPEHAVNHDRIVIGVAVAINRDADRARAVIDGAGDSFGRADNRLW